MSFLLTARRLTGALCLTAAALTAPQLAARAQAPAAPAPAKTLPPIEAVSLRDLDPAAYAADTGAAAVVLFDKGRTSFVQEEGGFKVRFERTRRVKILRETGLGEATVKIPLYHRDGGTEQVVSLRGVAWNTEAGKLTRTDTKSATATTVRRTDNLDERRLTLAGARVGSVVEIGYVTLSDFFFTLPEWWFQEDVPVRRSEYQAEIPQLFDYAVEQLTYYPYAIEDQRQQPYAKMSINGQQLTATHLHWAMLDVPAFRDEPFITTPADYLAHLRFQLRATNMPGQRYRAYTTTWKTAAAELLLAPRFGGVLTAGLGELTKPLKELLEREKDPTARAQAVVALVRNTVACDGRETITGSGPLSDVLRQHRGNVADVNLLLVSALQMAGLQAAPVILSTRDHGSVPDEMPLLERFNYVLALATLPGEAEPLLLDATVPYAAFGMLPEQCLNTRGRVIARSENDQRWVPVKSSHQYVTFLTGTVAPTATGAVKADLRYALTGYAAPRARRRAADLTPEKLVARYVTLGPGTRLTRHNLTLPTEPAQPVTLEVELATEGEGQPAALLFVALKDFGGMSTNPFRAPERRFPIDLGAPQSQTLMLDVPVPEGYVIETVPPPFAVRTPDSKVRAQFRCTPAPDGRSVQMSSALTVGRAGFEPHEYDALRQIYAQLVAKHAEPLVLKKADN